MYCRRDVAQEHYGVLVSLVEGDPRERAGISFGPSREERRLAVPGGCDNRGERNARRAQPFNDLFFRNRSGRIDGGASLTSTRSKGTSVTVIAEKAGKARP